jgi:2-dehydropantoate 2-reductase
MELKRFCVVGAGAIGGYLGAKLSRSGVTVTLVDQGEHLAAIQSNGLRLIMTDGFSDIAYPKAISNIADAGKQDVVILAVKAPIVPTIAPLLPSLYHAETMVLSAQNGIPWWYFRKHGGEHEGLSIQSVDPDGVVEANIGADRAIGCVVYSAAEIQEPGVIRHIYGDRFSLGEIDGTKSDRLRALAKVFSKAGIKAPTPNRIRAEVWVKLLGSLAFNSISALMGQTLEEICQSPLLLNLAHRMMQEGEAIASRLGVQIRITLEQRIQAAERAGAHKTSMLRDVEAGRQTEVEAILGSVIELGKITQVSTPILRSVYSILK